MRLHRLLYSDTTPDFMLVFIGSNTWHQKAKRASYTRCTWVFGLAECVIRAPGQGIATSHSKAYGEER